MKKILLCTSTFENGLGGVPAYARDFVNAFDGEYDIVVLTDYNQNNNERCRIIKVQDKNLSLKNARLMLSIIHNESPDIIINSSFLLLSVLAPFIPNSIKIITVSHFVNGYYARVAGYNSDYLDNIIALSSFGAKFIEKKYKVKKKEKIDVVYNFMEPLQDGPNFSKSNNGVVNIVYPGGSNRKKSADIFLKAMLRLFKTNLLFNLYWVGGVGIPGQKWPFTKLKDLTQILPSDNRISHIGYVTREQAQIFFKNANIFVLPSRGEGFPISLIEAMRGRCIPVISDAKHGALDVIKDGVNGYITKQSDYHSLADCLQNIVLNHNSLGDIYDHSFNTYTTELERSVWISRMRLVLQKKTCHVEREPFSVLKYNLLKLSTLLFLFRFHVLKEKIIDNMRAMLVYRIIYLNRNRY